MKINFNIENLDKLLLDFYKITGLTISVWDSEFNQLSFQPKEMPAFCRLIKSSLSGNRQCFLSDKKVCLECLKENKPVTHRCHAGLIDTAIPIKFKNTVLGFMMFGQVTDKKEEFAPQIERLSKELKLNREELASAYALLDGYDPDRIDSAANLLKMATRFLWLSNMIDIDQNDISVAIDDYIRTNIAAELSVNGICRRFNISKNKLYRISKEKFGDTIGNYIMNVRIGKAKHYLTNTDLLVNEVSSLVGIPDYNYFSKVFRRKTGYTPLKYRKKIFFAPEREQGE